MALVGALALMLPASALASTPPALTGSVADPVNLSGATSVAISGHYAYTTAYYAGELTAVDISNPAHPVVVGESATSTNLLDASTVNISGGYAYVVSKNRNASLTSDDDGTGNSLTILDIHTNPAAPTIVGTVRDPTELFGAYGVAISGNYAYVGAQGVIAGQPSTPDTGTGSLAVVDISNPASPSIVAHLDNNALPAPFTGTNALAHACAVSISGSYAYVTAEYSNRLTVIDISNPLSPTIVSTTQDNINLASPADVVAQGGYAYVADQTANGTHANFSVVNVSNPALPVVAGSIVDPSALDGAYRVRVHGGFAYVSASSTSTVAAIDITNPVSPRLAGTVTNSADLNRDVGLDVDPTGRYVVAASPYLPSQSQAIYPPFPLQAGGPAATGTVSAITLDPTPNGVTVAPGSEPPNPAPATARTASFSFSTSDAIASVACKLDSAPYGPCTSATTQQYSALALGSHTFTVQATDAAGNTSTASYTWTITTFTAPVSTSRPAISGTATQGVALTALDGRWTGTPSPTFTRRWQRCNTHGAHCTTIAGATGSRYVLRPADVGTRIRVSVTATNSAGRATAVSNAVGPVVAVTISHTSLTGISKRRAKLSFTVQAVRNTAPIKTIVVGLPSGLAFAKSLNVLVHAIVVKGSRGGARPKFTAKLSHGALTITFKSSTRGVQVTIATPGITVSHSLAGKVKHHQLKALSVSVKTTESRHQTASFGLQLKPS